MGRWTLPDPGIELESLVSPASDWQLDYLPLAPLGSPSVLLMNSYFPRISLKSTHSIFRDLKFSHALEIKKCQEKTKN